MKKLVLVLCLLALVPLTSACSRTGAFLSGILIGAVANEALDDDEVIYVEEHHHHHHSGHHSHGYHYSKHKAKARFR